MFHICRIEHIQCGTGMRDAIFKKLDAVCVLLKPKKKVRAASIYYRHQRLLTDNTCKRITTRLWRTKVRPFKLLSWSSKPTGPGTRIDARNATFNIIYGDQYNYHITVIDSSSLDNQPTSVSFLLFARFVYFLTCQWSRTWLKYTQMRGAQRLITLSMSRSPTILQYSSMQGWFLYVGDLFSSNIQLIYEGIPLIVRRSTM